MFTLPKRLKREITWRLVGFAVYELIDPRDRRVFYIGCGSGHRWYSTTMPSGARQIPDKHVRLVSIRESEKQVVFRVVAKFRSSECARAFERLHQYETFGSVRSCCCDVVVCREVAKGRIAYNNRVVIIDETNGYHDDAWGPKQRNKLIMTSPKPPPAKLVMIDLEDDDGLDLAGAERAARERGWTP